MQWSHLLLPLAVLRLVAGQSTVESWPDYEDYDEGLDPYIKTCFPEQPDKACQFTDAVEFWYDKNDQVPEDDGERTYWLCYTTTDEPACVYIGRNGRDIESGPSELTDTTTTTTVTVARSSTLIPPVQGGSTTAAPAPSAATPAPAPADDHWDLGDRVCKEAKCKEVYLGWDECVAECPGTCYNGSRGNDYSS